MTFTPDELRIAARQQQDAHGMTPPATPQPQGVQLAPCPFCASSDVHLTGMASSGMFSRYVLCSNCDAQGPFVTRADAQVARKDAIDPWNAVSKGGK